MDYKHEFKGKHEATLALELPSNLQTLAQDIPLADKHRDHPLTGQWSDHRDCHIKPDLVLIYRKTDAQQLQLVRLGLAFKWRLTRAFKELKYAYCTVLLNTTQGT